MSYVTGQMRAALAEHRLRQVCSSNGVRVFRMARPGTGVNDVDLVFLPERIFLGSLRWACASNGALQHTLDWFVDARDEARLCEAFGGPNGWLCAIQQHFAELYREREARIEAIVTGWKWDPFHPTIESVLCADRHPGVASIYACHDGRHWLACDRHGTVTDRGVASDLASAQFAARAAVLRQAKGQPELWYCGEVDRD